MKKILLGLFAAVVAIIVFYNATAPKRESTLAPAGVYKQKRTEVSMVSRESETIAPTAKTEEILVTNQTGPYHVRMEGLQVQLVPSRKQ